MTHYQPTFTNETLNKEMLNLVLIALNMAEDGDHYTDVPVDLYQLIQFESENQVEHFIMKNKDDYLLAVEDVNSRYGKCYELYTGQLNDPQFAKYVKHNMACRALEDLIYHFNQETSIDLSLAHIWKEEQPHQQFISYIQQHLA